MHVYVKFYNMLLCNKKCEISTTYERMPNVNSFHASMMNDILKLVVKADSKADMSFRIYLAVMYIFCDWLQLI